MNEKPFIEVPRDEATLASLDVFYPRDVNVEPPFSTWLLSIVTDLDKLSRHVRNQ
jgi:hypothetical protein